MKNHEIIENKLKEFHTEIYKNCDSYYSYQTYLTSGEYALLVAKFFYEYGSCHEHHFDTYLYAIDEKLDQKFKDIFNKLL